MLLRALWLGMATLWIWNVVGDAGGPAGPAPAEIAWEKDFDAALKKAKAENKPVMIAFILSEEPANEEVVKRHFHDPKIVGESAKFVCLVSCLAPHESKDGACPVFPGVHCEDHVKVELRARLEILASDVVSCPQFIFLAPDGKTVLLRHVWLLPAAELLRKMKLAHAYFDAANASDEFQQYRSRVDGLLKEADDNNADRRREALRTVALLDDPRIIEFLVRQTGPQADKRKRDEAIFYMGQRGNAKALPRLHELLAAKESKIRLYCAVSIAQIGMGESATRLATALKKENKDRVRSHLLRAFAICAAEDVPRVKSTLIDTVKRGSQVDKVTALHLIAGLEKDPDLVKTVLAAARSTNTRVRSAAYYVIGALQIEEGKKPLKSKLSSERGQALEFCRSALRALGMEVAGGDEYFDASSVVHDWLPDNKLYEGEFK